MQTQDIKNKLNRYLNGQMSTDEIRDFELLMENDPFLADAVEGYELTGAKPTDLSEVKDKIVHPIKRNMFRMVLGISVAASLILIAFYTVSNLTDNVSSRGNKPGKAIIGYNPLIYPQKDTTENNDSVNNADKLVGPYTAEIRVIPQKVVVPESIAPLHINKQLLVENNLPKNEIDQFYKYRSNHFYSYIGDFKVVDYRYDKRMNQSRLVIANNGVSFKSSGNMFVTSTEMTYVEFLEDALNKYDAGNLIEALSDFNVILDQYPKDLNAQFYKAICYYDLGQNEKSLHVFEISLDSRVNTFHEEAMWYRGLILKEQKQYAAAEKVLEEIVLDNGYYGVQAKKELDELYKIYLDE